MNETSKVVGKPDTLRSAGGLSSSVSVPGDRGVGESFSRSCELVVGLDEGDNIASHQSNDCIITSFH